MDARRRSGIGPSPVMLALDRVGLPRIDEKPRREAANDDTPIRSWPSTPPRTA